MSRALRIALGLALLGLGVLSGSRVHLDGDIGRLLPDRDPTLRQASAVLRSVMQRTVVELSLPEGGEDRLERLVGAAGSLAEWLEASPRVARVRARLVDTEALDATELLLEAAPLLLEPRHHAELEQRLEPAALEDALAGLRRRAHEPDAGWLLQQARRDPFGLAGFVLAPLEGQLAGFEGVRLVDGTLATRDGGHVLLFVEPSVPATDTDGARDLLADLAAAVEVVRQDPRLEGLVVRHLGAHRSTLDNQEQIAADVALTSTLGALFVALIAIFTLARVWWGLLALTPALFGGAIALGTVAFFRDSVATPVLGFGVALLGISVDYAIHVLYRLNAGPGARLPVRALFMGATTTACAFLALGISSLPALREVGGLGALGIVAAAVFAVVVLPALAGTPPTGRRPRFDLRGLLAGGAGEGSSRAALLVALVATPLLLVGAFRLELDGEVRHLSHLSPAAAGDEQAILANWGAAFRTTQVVVQAPELEEALEQNDRVAAVLAAEKEEGGVRDFASIAGLLPSRARQEAHERAWREFWSAERVGRLRLDLAVACETQGFDPGAFEPFFASLERAVEPLVYQPGDPLSSLVGERILEVPGGVLIATPVFVDSWEQVEALQVRLSEEVATAAVLNNEAMSRQLAALVGGELWKLGSVAFAAVALLVLLWLRSARQAALVLVPLALSGVWTLGALGWLGVPINLANSVFAAFLFGIAVDYAIFMTQARLAAARGEPEDLAETDASVLLCAATTCVGFGVLVLADHPVLHSIGITALTGIVAAYCATRLFVPALAGRLLAMGER